MTTDRLKQIGRDLKETTSLISALILMPLGLALLAMAYVIEFFTSIYWLPIIGWCLFYQACDMKNHLESIGRSVSDVSYTAHEIKNKVDRIDSEAENISTRLDEIQTHTRRIH